MPSAPPRPGDAVVPMSARALAQRQHDVAHQHHPELCDPSDPVHAGEYPEGLAGWAMMHAVAVHDGGATCPGLGGEGAATFAKAKGDGKAKGKAKDEEEEEEEEEEEDDDEIDDLDPEDEDDDSGEFDVEDLDDDEEEEEEDEDEPPSKGAKGNGAKGKKAGFAASIVAAFREWTRAKRDDLDEDSFAGPNRTFPIVDQADVDAAAKLIGRAKNPDAIRRKIIALCKKKGLKVPEAWAEQVAMSAGSHAGDLAHARFSAVIPTAGKRTEDGFNIYPNAILFESGVYSDKNYSMTREELWLAAENFAGPVGGNIEHTDYMRGRACQVRSVRLDPDNPDLLRGEVALPVGFDEHLIDEERRLSCEWDRATKDLTGLALTINPRVKQAALMAAFAAGELPEEDRKALMADRTYQGASLLQSLHDTAAAGGAMCSRKAAMSGGDGGRGDATAPAAFHSAPELRSLQAVHDAACEGGATCRMMSDDDMKSRAGMFAAFTERKKHEHAGRTHQAIHEVIRMGYPGVCLGGPAIPQEGSPAEEANESPATEAAETMAGFAGMPAFARSIKKIHAMTVEHGATCPGKSGMGKASMSDDPTTDERSIMPADNALTKAVGALLPDKPTDDDIKAILAAFPAEVRPKLATFAAAPAPDRFAKFADDPDFVAFKAEQDKQLQAERDRIAKLEADREADRKTAAFSAARDDAGKLCTRIGIGGPLQSNVASLLLSLGEVDRAHGPRVTFSDGGTLREDGSLADAFRAILGDLPARDVLPIDPDGKLDAASVKALFNGHQAKAEDPAAADEAFRRNLSYTETGRQILAGMTNGKGN